MDTTGRGEYIYSVREIDTTGRRQYIYSVHALLSFIVHVARRREKQFRCAPVAAAKYLVSALCCRVGFPVDFPVPAAFMISIGFNANDYQLARMMA